jgi:hypothetical protein
VDLLEEERDLEAQRSTIYQQNLGRYHSRDVQHCSFKEGDLVLRPKQQKKHKLFKYCSYKTAPTTSLIFVS